jgi:hypothetical protein
LHPIKKIKGEGQLIRQPIESLFNWIIDKTDIQNASKVRSSKGLLVHGKIISACLLT